LTAFLSGESLPRHKAARQSFDSGKAFQNKSFPDIFLSSLSVLNRAKLMAMRLVVRPSPIHSVGVYTSAPIRKGTRIIEYDGPRITAAEADERYTGAPRTYLYGIGDGSTVIDGEGIAAYMNHSCDPNCEVDEIKERVWIFALRDIAPGEELLWDYNLYDDEDPAPCHCGSPKCRGTMYSEDWLRKLKRRAARKKKNLEERKAKLRLLEGKDKTPVRRSA
jgi:SET domain-containing protein